MSPFVMPKFDGAALLETQYRMLLCALGLLQDSEEIEEGIEKAETALATLMPSYKLERSDGVTVEVTVGAKKFKTAAFMFALYRERGDTTVVLSGHLKKLFRSYITFAVIADAKANPGNHPVVDLFDTELTITLTVNLAKVA